MKKLLIVVDMQNDFVTGSLGSIQAEKIVPAVKAKIEEYKRSGDHVIFTRDTHTEDYLDTQEGKRLPAIHCVIGTEGHRIIDDLDTSGCEVLDKPTFGSIELAEKLAGNCIDSRCYDGKIDKLFCDEKNHKQDDDWIVNDLNVNDLNVNDLNVNDLNVNDLNVYDLNVNDLNVNDLNVNDLNVYDEIELCGLCTDICVVSNALILKAMLPETKVSVDASCCAGVTDESHRAALLTMKMCQVNVLGYV
jgi:nicotinamidase-related amidase